MTSELTDGQILSLRSADRALQDATFRVAMAADYAASMGWRMPTDLLKALDDYREAAAMLWPFLTEQAITAVRGWDDTPAGPTQDQEEAARLDLSQRYHDGLLSDIEFADAVLALKAEREQATQAEPEDDGIVDLPADEPAFQDENGLPILL